MGCLPGADLGSQSQKTTLLNLPDDPQEVTGEQRIVVFRVMGSQAVLVSHCCYDKWSQIWELQTTQIFFSLTVLEVRKLNGSAGLYSSWKL